MKKLFFLLGVGVLSLTGGCMSPRTVTLASVGPNPVLQQKSSSEGQLQVFTRLRDTSDDRNQGGEGIPWRQHTEYSIYNLQGHALKHVENLIGHYEATPPQITMPVGKYMVVAQARDYFWVKVPVTIKPGETTIVHLDDKWKAPTDLPQSDVAVMPNGKPMGWRAQ